MNKIMTQLEAQRMRVGFSTVPAFLDAQLAAAGIEQGDPIILNWISSHRLCSEGDTAGFLYHRYEVYTNLFAPAVATLLHTQIEGIAENFL